MINFFIFYIYFLVNEEATKYITQDKTTFLLVYNWCLQYKTYYIHLKEHEKVCSKIVLHYITVKSSTKLIGEYNIPHEAKITHA